MTIGNYSNFFRSEPEGKPSRDRTATSLMTSRVTGVDVEEELRQMRLSKYADSLLRNRQLHHPPTRVILKLLQLNIFQESLLLSFCLVESGPQSTMGALALLTQPSLVRFSLVRAGNFLIPPCSLLLCTKLASIRWNRCGQFSCRDYGLIVCLLAYLCACKL